MRTTLDIEDDVLDVTRELARRSNLSAGAVISRLLREALQGKAMSNADQPGVGGFRPFASRGVVVSDEMVNQLRDQEGV
jgi:hypothetical protein